VAKGNAVAAPPSWSWAILPAQSLHIAGNVEGGLYPGAQPAPIDLVVGNPHRYALHVRSASVGIAAILAPHSGPGLPCTRADFAVAGYRGGGFRAPRGSSTLQRDGVPRSQWPTIAMVERERNQDGCEGATVVLTYRGLASKLSDGG
jgi:hypothetical protein